MEKTCIGCGQKFEQNRKDRLHCTKLCAVKHYSRENKQVKKEYALKWAAKNREKERQYSKEKNARLRKVVIEAYGGKKPKCKCCGESDTRFLSIDHINGGGAKHKREIHGNLYRWLKTHGFPPGFQLLCHNCNQGKHIYGKCPHKITTSS